MLNEFMTAMSREILDAKGIVDKYVGDEIIGVFGAPKSYGQDAAAAVRAACRMRERLAELNEKRRGRGDPPLAMGIGINTGAVVAGCMGSEELMSYTCIGAAVNLTSRLCSNAKPGQILISEPARRAAAAAAGGGLEVHELEPIRVKGFDHPVPVFEVLSSPALPATPKPAPSGAGACASGGARSL
ncbi:MAG: adenylate/guanylate cyclase domain-containing protein [Planctomycetes bacterium]|nr:adenylate/guanylate cyclase domain-containing protein [Planctomycetota bacterium]